MNDFLLEPWPRKNIRPDEPTLDAVRGVTTASAIDLNADRIKSYRVGLQEGRRMSLAGKMAALTERATKFNTDTEAVLDGIAAKVSAAETKRDAAKDKHHAYYDTIIKGVDDSVAVIDRLSNGPLPEDGKS
ncbi:hypothetical protein [Bradyrhizobium sp.]